MSRGPICKKGGKACHREALERGKACHGTPSVKRGVRHVIEGCLGRTSFGKRGVKHVAEHPRAPLASGGKACHRTPVHVTELLSQQESEAYHRAPSEKGGVMHVRGQLWQMRVNYFAGPLFGKLGVQHIKKPLEVKHATEPFCQKGGKACQRASLAKKGSRHASLAKGG